jgi:hypothetical protein
MDTHSVPRDELIEQPHAFERPALADVQACFHQVHQASEARYHGDGSWGNRLLGPDYPPTYRNTAWRMIGYMNALQVEENPVYRQRLEEGAAYLLKEQQPNGSYLWWCYQTDGHPDTDNLLYCSANPGVALLRMYELTGESRYLDASCRAADWAVGCPISPNNNYNSFSVWHLCELYRVSREEKYLNAAIHKNREGGFPRQEANGAWAGHNAWIFYHAIIIRGFVTLYGVLPEEHPAKEELRPFAIAAVNHLLEEQKESGHFRSCWDTEEWERSRNPESGYCTVNSQIFDPSVLHALVLTADLTDLDVTNALSGVLQSPMPEDLDKQGIVPLAYGVGLRWLAKVSSR